MKRSRSVLLLVAVLLVIAAGLTLQWQPADGTWHFNFSPDSAPHVESFKTISAGSDYSRWRGYGWLDAGGPVERGKWPGDPQDTWESRHNLNVITRRGPDDLARSYATGPATFVLDLEPGKYEVWVLSGDAGHREYVPREPYRITVEGRTAYRLDSSAAEFVRQFETPVKEDELTHSDIWRRSIMPRFKWSQVVVDVEDGQLTVNVVSERRDNTYLELTGEYAHTETRSGPAVRFGGALNALVVLPVTQNTSKGRQAIRAIDAWRQRNMARKWPRIEAGADSVAGLTTADHERGYTVSPVNVLTPVMPQDRRPHSQAIIKLRATPGEYVPITFAITPLQALGETQVEFDRLQNKSDMAGKPVLTEERLVSGVVRHVARPVRKKATEWRPGPGMIVPATEWDIHAGVSKQFWLTYQVPDDLPAGDYTGTLEIKPEHAAGIHIDVELEVLPFRLQRPSHLAIGMTYFSPVQYAAGGEADFWRRLQAEFADMRAHNMTTIQYTGIRMDDYGRMDRAFSAYRNAGFEQAVNLLESYGAMVRWRRKGIPWSSAEFQTEYAQFIDEFLQQAEQRQWPPVIIGFGDEFTNRAQEEVGAAIAKRLKKIPGIVTAADVNGYKEMTLLAPEVDIVAFNNGWDGPDKVNRGKRLLNRGTVEHILEAGATPWLVNVGMDRFSNGYWLWKMVRLGVRGKMEWMYRGYNGMPFDNFDADPLRAHAVYPGPNGTAIPALDYERMRIGLDDLAYLYTLEQAIEDSRADPLKASVVAAADHFIRGLDDLIEDDMSLYRDPAVRSRYLWPVVRYDEVRREVIDLILQLYDPDHRR